MNLYDKLLQHHNENIYPYHMPGHKRKAITRTLERVADLDITEIDGFDNLNHPEDILLDVQKKAAIVYGADESFYLVGGSTLGLLSAISAVTNVGDTVLIGRNCHKAVYHAAYLRGLQLKYVYPEYDNQWEVCTQTRPEDVERLLKLFPEVKAVVIVSPTYEGFCSNISRIAEIVHSHGKILIVDEAHGAHFGFHSAWPKSAISLGADVVIQSLHKTLPSMTQTAIMHVKGDRIDCDKLRRFISVYQTSSPSYVFMASMEETIDYMHEHGNLEMENFRKLWINMLQRLKTCEFIDIFDGTGYVHDIGKLLISATRAGIDGQSLHQILRERFSLQMEMAQGKYVLAMFTVADESEAYDRLVNALLTLDAEYKEQQVRELSLTDREEILGDKHLFATGITHSIEMLQDGMQIESVCPLCEAWNEDTEWVELAECINRCAGDFINLYPPGVPIIVPGEIINQNLVSIIKGYCSLELPVHGVRKLGDEVQVKVLKRE